MAAVYGKLDLLGGAVPADVCSRAADALAATTLTGHSQIGGHVNGKLFGRIRIIAAVGIHQPHVDCVLSRTLGKCSGQMAAVGVQVKVSEPAVTEQLPLKRTQTPVRSRESYRVVAAQGAGRQGAGGYNAAGGIGAAGVGRAIRVQAVRPFGVTVIV